MHTNGRSCTADPRPERDAWKGSSDPTVVPSATQRRDTQYIAGHPRGSIMAGMVVTYNTWREGLH